MTFALQPTPVNLVAQGIAEGGNPLGLPRIKHQCKLAIYVSALAMGLQKLVSDGWTTLVDWQNAKDDVAVWTAPIDTGGKWKELGEKGLIHSFPIHERRIKISESFCLVWLD